jgi:hypothetical protein
MACPLGRTAADAWVGRGADQLAAHCREPCRESGRDFHPSAWEAVAAAWALKQECWRQLRAVRLQVAIPDVADVRTRPEGGRQWVVRVSAPDGEERLLALALARQQALQAWTVQASRAQRALPQEARQQA